MSLENFNMDEITEARREALLKTTRSISFEELKALGEALFPMADHPWRTAFFAFLAENPGAAFFHGSTDDRVHIIYCSTKEKGMWFLPGSGMGPLQQKGISIMNEVVANLR